MVNLVFIFNPRRQIHRGVGEGYSRFHHANVQGVGIRSVTLKMIANKGKNPICD
jgi:hypothetical protein